MFWWIDAAMACGGLACATTPEQPFPVVQNAERIAFGIDPVSGQVEVHVQVFYEGPPDEFAWVIPVTAEPEVFVSNDALFEQMDRLYAPRFRLDQEVLGSCAPRSIGCGSETAFLQSADGMVSDTGFLPGDDGVTVTSEGQVGPYDYVVLDGGSGAAVVGYLEDNGFDVTEALDPALAPYLMTGGRFLAIRLQKDRDTGDIAPLGFRYPGDVASVPIQLTAIAAADDMGLQVSVFGDARAVPYNYLHAEINEEKIDWFTAGSNYFDVVARAVDQAGGHAFVTDYAGDTGALQQLLWSDAHEAGAAALAATTDPSVWADTFNQLALPRNSATHRAFDGLVPTAWIDDGVPLTPDVLADVDLAALTAQVDSQLFDSLRAVDRLAQNPWVTRMVSTLDAAEMTLDPMFVLNPDLPPVDNERVASLTIDCRGSRRGNTAPRELTLSDGRRYQLGALDEVAEPGERLVGLTDIEAIRIERMDRSGPPTVLVDASEEADDAASQQRQACGCAGSGFAPGVVLWVGALVAIRRGRRRGARSA